MTACVVLVALITAVAATKVASGPEALVDAFMRAWNAHDAKAFSRLFSDDADWVTARGERLKGRPAIEAAFAKEHASWARATVLRATDVAVRDLDRKRVIVMFKWEIASDADAGAQPLRGNTVLVAAKDAQRCVIIAGQVAAVPASK